MTNSVLWALAGLNIGIAITNVLDHRWEQFWMNTIAGVAALIVAIATV